MKTIFERRRTIATGILAFGVILSLAAPTFAKVHWPEVKKLFSLSPANAQMGGDAAAIEASNNTLSGTSLALDGSGTTNYGVKWIDSDTLGTGTIFDNGNVGIGDITPLEKFTVGDGDLFRVTSSGYVRSVNGAAATPTYSFALDTNTGMYRGGTDNLKFATGGADRMTVTSSGRVGIGLTNPVETLHVKSSKGKIIAEDSDATGITDTTAGIDFFRNGGLTRSAFGFMSGGTFSLGTDETGGKLDFRTGDNSVKMNITAEGRVGIGSGAGSSWDPASSVDLHIRPGPNNASAAIRLGAATGDNEISSRLQFSEGTSRTGRDEMYSGFEFEYSNLLDEFSLRRYNDSTTGDNVFTIQKDDGEICLGTPC